MNSEVHSQSDAPTNKSNNVTLVLENLCEEMKELKILVRESTPTVGAASIVNSSTDEFNIIGFVSASNSQFFKNLKYENRPWILDLGAIDHMTLNPSNFISYVPCSQWQEWDTSNYNL